MIPRARAGDRVKVQYTGTSQDGTAIGTRRSPQVLEFTVGSDDVMPGIDKAVVGMAQGEKKKMTLQPHDGYGTVEKKKIKTIPRQRFPAHLELHVGKRLNSIGMSTGRHWLVHVVKILPDTVVVDANHSLAGKTLNMELQLVSLASSGDEKGRPKGKVGGKA